MKMHDHITDGPDEETERERNSYPDEPEYDKYLDRFAYQGPVREPESLDLRITLAIEHLVKYNSFDHRGLIELLKDCKRRIEG